MEKLIISGNVHGPLPCVCNAQTIERTIGDHKYHYTQYLPSSMKAGLPLVVELHGGGGNGEQQCACTPWAALAERENFVVIFPTATAMVPSMGCRTWRCQQSDYEKDADDIMAVIDLVIGQYAIDTERIYISGMSLGDMMSTLFAAKYGGRIAGLCSFNGPTNPKEWKEKICLRAELPVIQIRGELDATLPFSGCGSLSETEALAMKQEYLIWNREHWIQKNKADPTPQICLDEKKNWALFRGEDCDVRYVEYRGMGHVEPQDGMELAWRHCFSRYRRTDHGIQRILPADDIVTEPEAFALASGCSKVYTARGIEPLKEAPVMGEPEALPEDYWCTVCREDFSRKPALYAPLEMLVQLLKGDIQFGECGYKVIVNSEIYIFYADTYFVASPSRHFALEKPALLVNGRLWVPVQDSLNIMGFYSVENSGVVYCTDHPARLTRGFSVMLRKLLE